MPTTTRNQKYNDDNNPTAPVTPATSDTVTIPKTRYLNLLNIEKEAKKVYDENKKLKQQARSDQVTIINLNGMVASQKVSFDEVTKISNEKDKMIKELQAKNSEKSTGSGKRSTRPKREDLCEDVCNNTDIIAKYLLRKYIICQSEATLNTAAKEAYTYITDKTDLPEEEYVDLYRFILYEGFKNGKNDTQSAAKARSKGKLYVDSM